MAIAVPIGGATVRSRPSLPAAVRSVIIRQCSVSSSSSSPSRKLILFSKPGCCSCDGLKEKLVAAFALSSSDSLHDVNLQIRDITSNPKWEKAYQYEIPVLSRVLPDGSEEVIPRFSPRVSVELIHKNIAAALTQMFWSDDILTNDHCPSFLSFHVYEL